MKKRKRWRRKKKATEEGCTGRRPALRRPAASSEAAKAASSEAAEPVTSTGRKRKVSPMAKASPKAKVRKSGRKVASAPEPAGETMTEKEKRRHRAKAAFAQLQAANIPGLKMPKDLGDRISFTVKCPDGPDAGSSVGVILSSESFYISKAVQPAKWPTTCTHLKVGIGVEEGSSLKLSHYVQLHICFNCINPPITAFSISLTSLHICIVALPAFQPLPGRSEARCHLAMADQSIGRMGACPGCCGLGVACLNPWPVMFVLLLFSPPAR